MGMMAEVLPPGVKHREKPDLRAEMPPIGSDGPQRLGGRVEQDLVDRAGILEGNRGDLVGNGEDDMEILRIEKLLVRLRSIDPTRFTESTSGFPCNLQADHTFHRCSLSPIAFALRFPMSYAHTSRSYIHCICPFL